MTAYYNEIDPFAAEWLRQLIKAGYIAPGDVDTRSIVDVRPDDLRGYTQCHFFAGIGVWSYALRRAGWPDDRPVWTGSCPCQPFSAAGAGAGFADERHLWPHFHWLIDQCGPPVVLGEQVASKDGLAWLDLVQADLEGSGYASAAVDTCSAGVGAPHIRQRLYWLAHAAHELNDRAGRGGPRRRFEHSDGGTAGGMDDAAGTRHVGSIEEPEGYPRHETRLRLPGEGRGPSDLAHTDDHEPRPGRDSGSPAPERLWFEPGGRSNVSRLADDDDDAGLEGRDTRSLGRQRQTLERDGRGELAHKPTTGPTNGFWRDADWLFCRDGKWRPVEPGTFPLAHGAAARVGRLRGYGNAINAVQAQIFIEAVIETIFPEIDAGPVDAVRLEDLFA